MKDNWEFIEQKSNNINNIFDRILENRGISGLERKNYLNPDFYDEIINSTPLEESDLFVGRIRKAVGSKEKVGIYADYDADGIPGAAFLSKTLDRLNIDYEIFIPTRDQGYGLNKDGINFLAQKGCTIIITVDLGIKNVEEAAYVKKLGIDLIITDHHEPGDVIPGAYAVINPKLSKSKDIFKDLSGAGVIYKLVVEISKIFNEIDEKFLKWNLDLIAISTISDVVPLVRENRAIAKFGLKVINKTKNIGINRLIEISKISKGIITAYEVGFIIAPKINAPGRISMPIDSFRLLTTEDENVAELKAKQLSEENSLRQDMMDSLISKASQIINQKKLYENKIIIVSGEWQKGIIGPSASKLAERYSKPVIIFSKEGDMLTGSARSINEINIINILEKSAKYIDKYGGHKGAAGLKLKAENYNKFIDDILHTASMDINDESLLRKYYIDLEVKISEMTLGLYDKIIQMEPFGMGNKKPVFLSRNIYLENYKFIGNNNKHLSMVFRQDDMKIKSIYFNYPDEENDIKTAKKVDIIYNLENNAWNNKNNLQLQIIDVDYLN